MASLSDFCVPEQASQTRPGPRASAISCGEPGPGPRVTGTAHGPGEAVRGPGTSAPFLLRAITLGKPAPGSAVAHRHVAAHSDWRAHRVPNTCVPQVPLYFNPIKWVFEAPVLEFWGVVCSVPEPCPGKGSPGADRTGGSVSFSNSIPSWPQHPGFAGPDSPETWTQVTSRLRGSQDMGF